MKTYHNIKIDHNSDCRGELDALKTLLRENKRYSLDSFTNAQIVAIAIGELYSRLVAEKTP